MAATAAASSLALLAAFASMCCTALAADCYVDVNSAEMPTPQPVLLSSGNAQDFSSFLLPDAKGNVTVAHRQQVTVACPGSSFLMLDDAGDRVTAECVGESVFSVNSVRYTLNGLLCSSPVTPTARYTSASCGVQGRFAVVEVGFTVGTEFHRLYDVCFSNKTLMTAYTHHTIPASMAGAQKTNLSSVSWTDGSFYGKLDIEAAYSEQNVTITDLLNKTTDELFSGGLLERGALAPAADFMLESQQVSTFFGINSAPRWPQLDEGNWGKLETLLRQRGRELEVYTGSLGVLALDDADGVSTAIYLSVGDDGKKALPVPKYFWKIAYDPQKKICAVFITLNNPFATQEELETHRLCKDICSDIKWLAWNPSTPSDGLSYCCDYKEFKKKVPGIPELDVKGHKENSSTATGPVTWLTVTLVAAAAFTNSFRGV